MRAARSAAFRALSTPTHATGTPGGIWTIESKASSPSRTLLDERRGTPITGRSVWAAATPGSAAARPAPAISTRKPRSRAPRQYSATASGLRWAERTSSSWGIPRLSSSSSAGCIPSRSDSDPTRMPTSGASAADTLASLGGDIAAVPRAREVDPLHGRVGRRPCAGERVAGRSDGEDAAPVRDEPAVPNGRARLEDERTVPFGLLDPRDRRARVAPAGVGGRGEDDGHGGPVRGAELGPAQASARRGGEHSEEVVFEQRDDRLRLGIPETAIGLEDARPRVGQHQAGVERTDERRPAPRELLEHGAVDAVHDLLRVDALDGRVRAHAARVRPRVAVADALEVLRDGKRARSGAVGDREDGDLLALEELLDHDGPTEARSRTERRLQLLVRPAHMDAFAGREPVRLDDAGRSGDRHRRRGGDAGGAHDLLPEALRPLDPCRLGAGPEDGDPAVPELVRHTGDEGGLGPDDDEIDGERPRQLEDRLGILGPDGMTGAERRDARIPRSGVELLERRRLRQPPGERMLTAARAEQEELHRRRV